MTMSDAAKPSRDDRVASHCQAVGGRRQHRHAHRRGQFRQPRPVLGSAECGMRSAEPTALAELCGSITYERVRSSLRC